MTPQRESTDPIEVFFSYAHEDEAMLEELKKHLATLKNRGYISSWDDRQIAAGQEWAGRINEHINSSNVILLLVSADFLASTYCYEVEMRRAMERHEAREAQVIPVILRPCDWQGTPFDKLKVLPKDGKPVTDWPTRDLAFLNIVQGLREAAGWSSSDVDVSSPVITGQATAGLRAIRPPVVDFVGRAEEIERISKSLAQSDGARASGPICVVRGMGGMGKTQLAYKVAQHLESAFPDGQLLIELRGEASNPLLPQQALQTIVTSIDRNAKPPDDPVAMEAMFQSTLGGKRVLIVADNAKGADQVRPLLPPKGSALLITTRQRFTLPGMVAIDLDTLPADAAEQLLRQICPRIGEAAGRLANLCGYLPLALRVSASVLASDDTIRIERYLDRLGNERERLKVLHDPDDPAHDVEANLRLSYDALESAAQDALCQMGVFPASFDLKAAVAVIVPTGVADVEELLSLLHRRSLVDWVEEEQRYRLHDLVRAFAVAQLSDNEVARRHARYFAHLVTLVNQQLSGDTVEDGTDADDFDVYYKLWDEQANIEAGMEWARTHAGDDEADELLLAFVSTTDDFYDITPDPETIEAALALLRRRGDQESEMSLLGRSADFYMVTDSIRARDLLEKGLSVAQQLDDRSAEGRFLIDIGMTHWRLKQTQLEVECYEKALGIGEENDLRWLQGSALINLGNVNAGIVERARYEPEQSSSISGGVTGEILNPSEAIKHYEQALQIWRESKHVQAEAATLDYLGRTYDHLGELDKALECYEHALAQTENDDSRARSVLISIGDLHYRQGHLSEAQGYTERLLKVVLRSSDRALEGQTLSDLGFFASKLNDLPKALAYYEQALLVIRELGNKQFEGDLLYSLGEVSTKLGDVSNAAAYYEEALPVVRDLGNKQTESNLLCSLGDLSADLDDFGKAVTYYEQALQITRELGDQDATARLLNASGYAYLELKRHDKAAAYFEQTLSVVRDLGIPSLIMSTLCIDALLGLVQCYDLEEQRDAQVSAAQLAWKMAIELNNPDIMLSARMQLGLALSDSGFHSEGIQHLEAVVNETPYDTAAITNLGWVLYQAGEYDRSLTESHRALGIDPSETVAIRNLGHAYLAKGLPDDAEREYRRAIQDRKGGEHFIETIQVIKKLLTQKPDVPRGHEMLRLFEEEQEKLEEGEKSVNVTGSLQGQ